MKSVKNLLLVFLVGSVISLKSEQNLPIPSNDLLLVEAIKVGDVDDVIAFIKDGINRDKEIDGNTPLLYSIIYRQIDVLNALIHLEADLDKSNTVGDLPIDKAIEVNFVAGLQALVENKVDVNRYNVQKLTPLMVAVMAQNQKAVEILIKAQTIDLLLKNSQGKDALELAREIELKNREKGFSLPIPNIIGDAILERYPHLERQTIGRLCQHYFCSNPRLGPEKPDNEGISPWVKPLLFFVGLAAGLCMPPIIIVSLIHYCKSRREARGMLFATELRANTNNNEN
jgi:hypothetical protein